MFVLVGCGSEQASSTHDARTAVLVISHVHGEYRSDGWTENRRFNAPNVADVGCYVEEGDHLEYHAADLVAEGEYRVEVPNRPRVIRIGATYLTTDAEEILIGSIWRGRLGVPLSSPGTDLRLQVSGIAPWEEADGLEIVPHDAYFADFALDPQRPLEAGAIVGTLDAAYVQRPIFAVADGDRFVIGQRRFVYSDTGWSASGLVRVSPVLSYDIADGTRTEITTSVRDRPLVVTPQFSWDAGSALEFQDRQLPRAMPQSGATLDFTAAPCSDRGCALVHSRWASTGTLEMDGPGAVGSFQFSDPYPPTWSKFIRYRFAYTVNYETPSSSAEAYPTTEMVLPLDEVEGSTVRHEIGPVRDLRIDGRSALEPINDVSAAPEITWMPPDEGVATGYFLEIWALAEPSGSYPVAQFVTRDLGVRLPPDVLVPGAAYYIYLSAYWLESGDLTTAPFQRPRAYGWASSTSDLFSL